MDDSMFNICTKDKSDEEAQKYREIGNKYFFEKDWFYSLLNYNASILFAKSKTVASLGYGNRSAVYFETRRYKDCLLNMKWALDNEYPEEKREKFTIRIEKCKIMMAISNPEPIDPLKVFELSYPANEKIPWLVDCVEMRRTKVFGRGIYATRDLKPGNVICVEEPVFTYTNEMFKFVRCYQCAKGNAMNLIPCDQTASMMFCSTECKKKLYKEAVNLDEISSVDVKMLSNVSAAFGSVEKFDNFIHDTDLKNLNKSIFDYDWTETNDPEYKKNLMACLLSLSTNDHIIDNSCHIRDYVSEKAVQHLLSVFNINNKNSYYLVNSTITQGLNFGHQVSLFESLINHSCFSNVICMNLDNKVFTIVFRAIKEGEQLFVNYDDLSKEGDEYFTDDIHLFKCKCEVHRYMKNHFVNLPSLNNAGYIMNLIKTAIVEMILNNPEKVKRSMVKIWDDLNQDTSIPNFMRYNYPHALVALRMITFSLTYPITF
ncbi:hypothetical protein ACKWTF_010426 [Chironomus riparius]